MSDEQKDILEEGDEVEAHRLGYGVPADSAPKSDDDGDDDGDVEAHYKAHTP